MLPNLLHCTKVKMIHLHLNKSIKCILNVIINLNLNFHSHYLYEMQILMNIKY